MSTVLFNHVIDWIMRRTREDRNRGIRWTPFSYLEDLDYADDLGLLSHTHSHIQGKTQQLNIFAKQVGLNISSKKTEIMALNTTNRSPVQVENGDPPYIRTGSPILAASSAVKGGRPGHPEPSQQGQKLSYHDEHCMALLHLQHSHHSCVLTSLQYGSECWRLTEKDLTKLSTFHTKSLRRILRIFWPKTISNKDLLKRCVTESMATFLTRRRWRWIGHVTRQEASITKTALHWTPEGKGRRVV